MKAIYCLFSFLAFRTWILIIFITPHHVQAILVQDWHFLIFCSNPMCHTSKMPPPYQSSYQFYETSWNHSSNHPCFFPKKLGENPKSWDFRETMYVWNAVYTLYIYIHLYTSNYIHLYIYIYIYIYNHLDM